MQKWRTQANHIQSNTLYKADNGTLMESFPECHQKPQGLFGVTLLTRRGGPADVQHSLQNMTRQISIDFRYFLLFFFMSLFSFLHAFIVNLASTSASKSKVAVTRARSNRAHTSQYNMNDKLLYIERHLRVILIKKMKNKMARTWLHKKHQKHQKT